MKRQPGNGSGAALPGADPQMTTPGQEARQMQDTTTPRPDARTIHRRRMALLARADHYTATDPSLVVTADAIRVLVRQRLAVGA